MEYISIISIAVMYLLYTLFFYLDSRNCHKWILNRIVPFIVSLGGVLSDYLTTRMGLGLGYYETHVLYNPLSALSIFWGATTMLAVILPKRNLWDIGITSLAAVSYLGTVNNILVILGIFPGLII